MDGRKALIPGTKLRFKTEEYTIQREIGRGGSCIVYDAIRPDTLDNPKLVRIKELYPHSMKVRRLPDNTLEVMPEDQERFNEKKEQMRKAYQKNHELFCMEELTNSITNTWDILDSNGTIYILSIYINGETLAEHSCKSIHECAALMLSTAKVIQKIHEANYLYLDLKPENILTIQGTTELVQLFDFDSLVSISVLERAKQTDDFSSIRISYSKGFASLEQATGKLHALRESSDIYSLGAVLFYLLWGRIPTAFDCMHNTQHDYETMKFLTAKCQDKLFRELTVFFHHTLASYSGDRYQKMENAVEQLGKIVLLSYEKEPWIISASIQAPGYFTGRTEDKKALDDLLHMPEHRLFSLAGMAGIGKSTLAQSYLADNREEYDAVVWMYDQGAVYEMISNDAMVQINTVEKEKDESLQEYADRKKRKLREIVLSQHVLAVVDNVEPEHLNDLMSLQEIGWDILLISRKILPEGICPALHLDEMRTDDLTELFIHYSHVKLESDQDNEDVNTIIKRVYGHTLTVELLARQIAKSHLSLHEAAQLVEQTGFKDLPTDSIDYIRDGNIQKKNLIAILDQIVELDHFTDVEKQIMKVLSTFGYQGIQINLFRDLMNTLDLSVINELEDSGWLSVNHKQITLHPLMLDYLQTWKWDDNCRHGADMAMNNLYQMILPKGAQSDSDKQFTDNYSELYRLLTTADQMLKIIDYDSAAKQSLEYRVLMDSPVDQDETTLDRMLKLLESPEYLDDRRILRLFEQSSYLLGRLNRYDEAFTQLEKMKAYISLQPSTFYISLYHRAMAETLHNSDMYKNVKDNLKHIDMAIIAARKSSHPEAQTQLAVCLLDKATTLICMDIDDDKAAKLIEKARPLIMKNTGEYDEERYYYYCRASMYAARHEEPELAEQLLENATHIADIARDSDLSYIDHLVEQSSWIYRSMLRYDKAIEAVKEAIDLCSQHSDQERYYQVQISTWFLLAEIYEDAGEQGLFQEAFEKAHRLREDSPWPLGDNDPIYMI